MLVHAADQVDFFRGIGDLLEDDLAHLHQISKKISDRTSRIKTSTSKHFLTHKWRQSFRIEK
jgi:hypothetical protein